MTIKVRLAQQEHIWGERNVYYSLILYTNQAGNIADVETELERLIN